MTASKYPVAIFELISASAIGAGFVREDTINSKDPVYIVHPKNRVIMSESVVPRESETEKGVFVNVPTRYIYGSPIILKEEQDQKGVKPNPMTDKINFINGFITVPKNGAYVGLYNMLKSHAQNLSNPEAPKDLDGNFILTPIFREIKPAEDAENTSLSEFLKSESVMYIRQFVNEKGGHYTYNEERIEALAVLFGVYGETVQQKTEALVAFAKTDPQIFLTKAKANEQTVLIEISHAIRLKVISFEGSSAVYVPEPGEQPTKIKTFTGRISEDNMPNKLADYFGTVDGKQAYDLFKAKLDAAKQKILSQQ